MERITLRLPSMGKEFLERQAEKHDQSVSAEIRCRLERDAKKYNERTFCTCRMSLEKDSLQADDESDNEFHFPE